MGGFAFSRTSLKKINDELSVVADNRIFKIGIFEFDEEWFPLKSANDTIEQSIFDSEEDDDVDGISDTVFDDGNDEDGGDDYPSVEMVKESKLEGGDESEEAGKSIDSGEAAGDTQVLHENWNSHIGELQQTTRNIPAVNSPGNLGVDPIIVEVNSQDVDPKDPTHVQLDVNGASGFGPGDPDRLNATLPLRPITQIEPIGPFNFSATCEPNLKFKLGTSLSGKQRRTISPARIIANKKHHLSELDSAEPPTADALEGSKSMANPDHSDESDAILVSSPPQSIDLNRVVVNSEGSGRESDGDPSRGKINEFHSTIEVGQMVGFQINEECEILAEMFGENGELIGNQ
ncbi:hypothetical protein L1887_19120 [Cichorium endivia]|nr:hypothetical protein L1887_19120 [Cichorium endivia]